MILKFKWNIIPFKLQNHFNPSMPMKNIPFKLQKHLNLSMAMNIKIIFFFSQVLVKKLQKEIVHLKNELAMHDTLVGV